MQSQSWMQQVLCNTPALEYTHNHTSQKLHECWGCCAGAGPSSSARLHDSDHLLMLLMSAHLPVLCPRRLVMEDIAETCSSSASSDSDGSLTSRSNDSATRVVAFDRPPFGLSSRPVKWTRDWENPYTQEAAAETCIRLMDKLGMQR